MNTLLQIGVIKMVNLEVIHLTKDYGHGRGVFDINLSVNQGECYGFLGPNGAGKTTTIRHLMGFSRPQKGETKISGKDSWKNAAVLQNTVGYLPGEIALPSGITGTEFIKMMMKMRNVSDNTYCNMLLKKFELDPDIDTKKMSLGVKRKLAVVVAFLHDPDILILDEPTSGLDPVMQETFIDFVRSEKERGKTIFLSSHIFHEIDAVCDRIAIIKSGRIVSEFSKDELKNKRDNIYRITFEDERSYQEFVEKPYAFASKNPRKKKARVHLEENEVNKLLADIVNLKVADFQEVPFTLEDYFMQFYKDDRKFEEAK